MAGQLVFSEENYISDNIFKFEQRLKTHLNKYIENGILLCTYFPQNENETTVDRGIRDVDQLFGKKSPIRFNEIKNFPLAGFGQTNPDNTDEMQIEDITVEGDAIILPSTVVPNVLDCFIINHLKMTALFQVTTVNYDSMKVDGFYKIHYRLYSTEESVIQDLQNQVVGRYTMDLNSLGSNINPVIEDDEFVYRVKVKKMLDKMIESYRAMYYSDRHNCFLFHNPQTGLDWFDLCGNEFMAKHSIMNVENSSKVIVLHNKINDIQLPIFYNNSVYNWLELGAPSRLLQKFYFILNYADGYPYSSFAMWNEGDIQIMQPISTNQAGINAQQYSFFDDTQLSAFMNSKIEPASDYEKLIWKYIHKGDSLTVKDVSLYTADSLISSVKHLDTFLYTPIVVFIIKSILRMN